MGDTTFTDNYQIKEIGTGREAGTWGNSTNENLSRIEGALGRTVSLDVTAMPTGSTSATSGNSWVAEWITINASNSGSEQAGSEGRCRVVEFTGTVSADTTVKIRGANSSAIPARVLFVKNSLSGTNALILDADGDDYTIPTGGSAIVAVVPTATGGFTKGVHSVFGSDGIQVSAGNKVQFLDSGEIQFVGDGTIRIKASDANALTITDGSRNWIILNSVGSGGVGVVDINAGVLDVGTQNTSLLIRDSQASAFTVTDGTTTFVGFDSSANEIDISATVDINTSLLNSASQSTAWTMIDNSSAALVFTEGVLSLLTFVTSTGSESVSAGVRVSAPDMLVTGTDGYVNFDTTTGSSGFGVRNNSGVVEAKHSGGSWSKVPSNVVALAVAAATTATPGEAKQGAFDIGPIRLIFNTITITGGDETITLGDSGDGTSLAMDSTLHTVMVCDATTSTGTGGANVSAGVESASAGTFRVRGPSGVRVTYWAIGDSGA